MIPALPGAATSILTEPLSAAGSSRSPRTLLPLGADPSRIVARSAIARSESVR
jgi:hypothetical protein